MREVASLLSVSKSRETVWVGLFVTASDERGIKVETQGSSQFQPLPCLFPSLRVGT
jgi:hypothetical protein